MQVDEWRREEANVLAGSAGEYRRLARQLEAELDGLNAISEEIYNHQIVGPPGEHFRGLWLEWWRRSQPLVARLYALSSELDRLAGAWQAVYREQQQAAADEAQRAQTAAKK